MDITNIWESIAGRNPMFLVAAGSVALGITLIIAAGITQVRRFQARSRHADPIETARPEVEVEKISIFPALRDKPTENPELQHLLRRLRAASDKLAKSLATDVSDTAVPSDSPLKRSTSGVEYIFKAGTG